MPIPSTLPQNSPCPIINTENQRNVCRIVLLRAPRALRIPIICVLSKMMISRPLIMVNPATHTINTRIIQTLISSSSSQTNTCGYASYMVLVESVLPLLSVLRFTCLMKACSVLSSCMRSPTDTSTPLQASDAQPFNLFAV